MKLNKNSHDHTIADKLFKHIPDKLRQYAHDMYKSSKCKNMSHGSYDIMRSMSWAHGENWRRNHPKSLNKKH